MKVIDLLNKIANGEEVPKKIKVGNKIYNYETFNIGKGDNYFTAEWGEVKGYRISYDGTYYYLEIRDYNLNDEVEILEEEKKTPTLNDIRESYGLPRIEEKKIPLKINKIVPSQNYVISDSKNNSVDERLEIIRKRLYANELYMLDIANTLNEIIDYLKSKGDE